MGQTENTRCVNRALINFLPLKGIYTLTALIVTFVPLSVPTSVVKNIDISISIDTEISERYQY